MVPKIASLIIRLEKGTSSVLSMNISTSTGDISGSSSPVGRSVLGEGGKKEDES